MKQSLPVEAENQTNPSVLVLLRLKHLQDNKQVERSGRLLTQAEDLCEKLWDWQERHNLDSFCHSFYS